MKSGQRVARRRVLAIDPTSKGFGYAVLESPAVLVDWGVKHARADRNAECLQQARELIDRYQPEVLVVEDTALKSSRRCSRAAQLIENLLLMAAGRDLGTRRISRLQVQRCFSDSSPATKRQVAVAIARRFPELEPYLPPIRKPWMSEDERMSIFDAVAFGYASYESLLRRRQAFSFSLEAPSSHV